MNFKVKTYNAIAETGISLLKESDFSVSETENSPDAMILRSYKLTDKDVESSIKAIARAGAGVNNVPVDLCSKNGIVVFNTPGANANAVKEIVLAGLLLSSRGIYSGANYINDIIDSSKHHIISSVHPSPLSAHRGFFGSKPFSKTNKFLISKGISPIDWELN